jgi:hypothetical protein
VAARKGSTARTATNFYTPKRLTFQPCTFANQPWTSIQHSAFSPSSFFYMKIPVPSVIAECRVLSLQVQPTLPFQPGNRRYKTLLDMV